MVAWALAVRPTEVGEGCHGPWANPSSGCHLQFVPRDLTVDPSQAPWPPPKSRGSWLVSFTSKFTNSLVIFAGKFADSLE